MTKSDEIKLLKFIDENGPASFELLCKRFPFFNEAELSYLTMLIHLKKKDDLIYINEEGQDLLDKWKESQKAIDIAEKSLSKATQANQLSIAAIILSLLLFAISYFQK